MKRLAIILTLSAFFGATSSVAVLADNPPVSDSANQTTISIPATTNITTTTTDAASTTSNNTDASTGTSTTSGDQTTTDSKISTDGTSLTPESKLYIVKRLWEDLKLTLTFSDTSKAKLLSELSQERLAEIQKMIDDKNTDGIEALVKDYVSTLNKAESIFEKLAEEGKETTEVSDDLAEAAEQGTTVDLPKDVAEETTTELETTTIEISIKATVVKDVPKEIVTSLRQQGLGYGQIALISKIADKSGKNVDDVMKVFQEKHGIGQTMHALGINPSDLHSKGKKKQRKDQQGTNTEDKNNTAATTAPSQDNEETENTTGNTQATDTTAVSAQSTSDATLNTSSVSATTEITLKGKELIKNPEKKKINEAVKTDKHDNGKGHNNGQEGKGHSK